ncbi:MAG TPA: hypothetical protein VLC53_17715 [Myxococcota bacterium]|nr:hypothetical protein [Myxococcota bacterium]
MDLAAHPGQHLRARVGDVECDVHQVLPEPHHRDGRLGRALPAQEVHEAGDREEELPERAAEDPDRHPEDAQEDVPRLVEQQVRAVHEMPLVGEDQPSAVEGEQAGQEGSRHALPFRSAPSPP